MDAAQRIANQLPTALRTEAIHVMAEAAKIRALRMRFAGNPDDAWVEASLIMGEESFDGHFQDLFAKPQFKKMRVGLRDAVQTACMI